MARYCDGDANAFRELYGLVAPRLFGYLAKMARDRAVADDLLQLTFMKVHRARAVYIRGADPLPWFYAIAHRTFLDNERRLRRASVRFADEAEPEVTADPDGGFEPAVLVAALDALAELPAPLREAVVLVKLDGQSVARAAEMAGTTTGAMRVRAHRGYAALRKIVSRRTAIVRAP